MARYWLGPWVWGDDGNGGGFWQMPSLAQASLDLRSPAACAVPVTPTGVGLFVTANAASLGAGYTNLGTDPQAVLSGAQKAGLRTLLNLPNPISALDLEGAIWEAMTEQSDPDGVDRMLPLVPQGRRFELWLGGNRVREFALNPGNAATFTPFILMLRRLYRQHRLDSLEGRLPPLKYRQILGYWVRKYGLPYRLFQPDDLPDESDLPPETTITESFNTANSSTLGPDLSWAEVAGDSGVNSNLYRNESAAAAVARARATTDLSSSDNYCQLDASSPSTNVARYIGPACRYQSGADTCYAAPQFGAAADPGVFRISKFVAGVRTDLGTGTNQTRAGLKKISANGTTIKAYHAGGEVESLTDSSIAAGTRAGIVHNGTNTAWFGDSFEAADLAVGGAVIPVFMNQYRQRWN